MFDSTKTPSSNSDRCHSEVMGANCMGVETRGKWFLSEKNTPYQQSGTPFIEEYHPNLDKKTNSSTAFTFKWTTQQPCYIC